MLKIYLLGFVVFGFINYALLFMAWRSSSAMLKWHQYLVPMILWPIAVLVFPYLFWREYKRASKRNDNR